MLRGVALLGVLFGLVCVLAVSFVLALPPVGEPIIVLAVNREGDTHIYAKDPTRDLLHRITYRGTFNGIPHPSPDGAWIAFISNRAGNTEVFVMDRYGGQARNLSNHPERDHNPYWTPDSQYIRFTSERGDRAEWWVTDLHGTPPRRLIETNIPAVDDTRACRSDNSPGAWSTCSRSETEDVGNSRLP